METITISKLELMEIEREIAEMASTTQAVADSQAQRLLAIGAGIRLAFDAIYDKFEEDKQE